MKICLKCKHEKSFSMFSKDKKKKDGYQIYCKECKHLEYLANKEHILKKSKENYWQNRNEKVAYRRKYYQENKEKVLESIKRYNEANPEAKRDQYLRRNYGIDLQTYEQMLKDQDRCCAVCGHKADYNLVVDHNHNTGETRGLLCQPCNQALGLLKDSPSVIENARKYLIEKGHYGPEVIGSP